VTLRKRVYIAGPYTGGDRTRNIRAALDAAERLIRAGFAPVCPHTMTFLQDLVYPHDYETWLECCLAQIPGCAALLRIPGTSPGADREEHLALRLRIPVYDSVEILAREVQP
jgi:hypothetical protein